MQLALDPLWRQQAKELPERNILRASAVGRIPGVEVYASNSISVDTSTVSGNSINHGVVFGPGMVGYVAGRDGCFVANSTNDNYGNDTRDLAVRRGRRRGGQPLRRRHPPD